MTCEPTIVEIETAADLPPVLALGADGKASWCMGARGRVLVAMGSMDLGNPEGRESFREEAGRLIARAGVSPALVAHDLHPDFFTTRTARSWGPRPVAVQHHHAHLAAVLMEHGLEGPVIGVTFDGMGLGDGGGLWGGEFLVGDLRDFRRAGHLAPVRQPGGDAAVREPWRMALSLLHHARGEEWEQAAGALLERRGADQCRMVVEAVKRGLNAPETTSAGRWFEGVSSLLGLGDVNDGPAAVALALERAAVGQEGAPLDFEVRRVEDRWIMDGRALVRELVELARDGAINAAAAGFHGALVRGAARVCEEIGKESGTRKAALAGGVFMNRILREGLTDALVDRGFAVYVGEKIPPHDGGLSLGQAGVAMAKGVE